MMLKIKRSQKANQLKRRSLRPGNLLRSIGQDQDGAVLLEYAFVLPVFLFLVFMNLYVGYFMIANYVLNQGLMAASELMRKELVKGVNTPDESEFRAFVCEEVNILLSCEPTELKLWVIHWNTSHAWAPVYFLPNKYWYRPDYQVHILRFGYRTSDLIPGINYLLHGRGRNSGDGYIMTPIILSTKESIPRTRDEFLS